MAAIGSSPFKAVTKKTECANCGKACQLEGELWTNTLNIQQWRLLPGVCCKRCGQELSNAPSSYASDLRDAFWAPEIHWREKGAGEKKKLGQGLGVQLGVELAAHLDGLSSALVLRFARAMDASTGSAFRALCKAAEEERFAIFDDRLKLWRDELISLQNEIISELAQVWARYEIPLSDQEWVPKATSVIWRPLQNAPLRWIVESLGVSADATIWTAPSWLYHGPLEVIGIRSVGEWEATQNLLKVLCHSVERKLSLEREQTLNNARRALRLQSRATHEREVVGRLRIEQLPGLSLSRAKPVRDGKTVDVIYQQLKRVRNLYRNNGWTASQLRQNTPEIALLWEWVDRMPEQDRRTFLNVREWDDGDKFIYLQIATLYEHAGHVSKKPSWATVRDWRKAYKKALKEAAKSSG